MKSKIWMKKLLGVCLAVGVLTSTVGCQRNDAQPETTGAMEETTEETKPAMGSIGNHKTPEPYRPGMATEPGKVTEPTEPKGDQTAETQPTEPEETQPKEPQIAAPRPTEPKETQPVVPRPTEPKETQPRETEPPHTHSHRATVTAPTCTGQGYTVHKCSCGDSYTDSYTAALGHSFGDWSTTREPTTEAEGQQTRTCSRCGATETRSLEKLEPEPGITEADIPALEAYARSYAESVGFTIDTSMNKGNSGYFPAGHMGTTSFDEAKADIREGIDALKVELIARAGSIEGARYNCIIEPDACWVCGGGCNGFGIFDLYG